MKTINDRERAVSDAMHIVALKIKEFDPLSFDEGLKVLHRVIMHLYQEFCRA